MIIKMISKTSNTSIRGVTLMNGAAVFLLCFSLFISSLPENPTPAYTNGTYKTHKTYKSHSQSPRENPSLNLKAACGRYRAEIDDRNRTCGLIGPDALEYSALRHGGRKALLNRRVIRGHVVRNL